MQGAGADEDEHEHKETMKTGKWATGNWQPATTKCGKFAQGHCSTHHMHAHKDMRVHTQHRAHSTRPAGRQQQHQQQAAWWQQAKETRQKKERERQKEWHRQSVKNQHDSSAKQLSEQLLRVCLSVCVCLLCLCTCCKTTNWSHKPTCHLPLGQHARHRQRNTNRARALSLCLRVSNVNEPGHFLALQLGQAPVTAARVGSVVSASCCLVPVSCSQSCWQPAACSSYRRQRQAIERALHCIQWQTKYVSWFLRSATRIQQDTHSTHTHAGTCTRNQSASMSTFHIQLSTFHCCCCCYCFRKSFSQCKCKFAPRCMPHASPGWVSVNAVRPRIPFSHSLFLFFLSSVHLCAVTFVMKLKCMLHACRVFLLCRPLLTLQRLTVAASRKIHLRDVTSGEKGANWVDFHLRIAQAAAAITWSI